ncbi:DUF3857 domain-containing protein [Croceivirga thetidis]|uniref:DUF3857 domain-containing protein n=1 Tax=Croceivirga thetidis TaxID=2721623 RepID=A0ABX1GT62_9FLAO|nr:DUF3857 domain-containing protein [Croceivirga thetidis]NKI33144.1 DUF3857 domain-containing protein [Croceivirga thetidis]
MKNKAILLISFLCIAFNAPAQEILQILSYDWASKPVYEKPSGDFDIFGIKEKQLIYFDYEGGDLTEHYLEHKVVWLNSDEKIEEYNKVYLPYADGSNLKVSKARVITPNNSIIDLDKTKIFTSKDEETGQQYKYFAFEGLEKGSFIEYLYVAQQKPDYNGTRIKLQSTYPKKEVDFELVSPKNLLFASKSFNGLPEANRDSLPNGNNRWNLKVENMDGLEKEDQSAHSAYLGQIIYKLDSNTATKGKNLTSYANVSQNLYAFYYKDIDKKVDGLLDKFIKENNLANGENEDATLSMLDNYLKTTIFLTEGNDPGLSNTISILENKVANRRGIVQLYVQLFSKLGIKNEMVLTSDRNNVKFDPEFESYSFLNNFLFYFPNTKKFLAPNVQENRYGFPPIEFTDNYGLFIKEVKLGSNKSAIGKIKYIDAVEAELNVDVMDIKVSFDENDITKTNIQLNRSFSGYNAMYFQPFMNLMPKETKEELVDQFAKTMHEDIQIISKDIQNGEPESFGKKPIVFSYEIEADVFMEKAGRKHLFKLGDLIGPQIEMYQDKKRKLPLESQYERTYYRNITIEIPKGYKVVNPEDITIDYKIEKDGELLFFFDSSYTLKDNLLSIKADEQYNTNIVYPEILEGYRQVINGAADFNKIKLIFEQEQ